MRLKHWMNHTACWLLVAFPLRLSAASPLEHWHPRNAGASNTLTALTYADGQFIAVDEVSIYQAENLLPSALLVSTNGQVWSRRQTGTNYLGARSITSQNGLMVVMAYGSPAPRLLSSRDGETWSDGFSLPLPRSVKSIDGQVVSAGWEFTQFCPFEFECPDSVALLRSFTNGVERWSAGLSSLTYDQSFLGADIAYGNGTWVVIGWIGGSIFRPSFTVPALVAWSSTNGANFQRTLVTGSIWSPFPWQGFLNQPMSLAFGNGTFVAAVGRSKLFASSDGVTWTNSEPSPTQSWSAVTFGAGHFVAVGSPGVILTSQDGLAWTPRNSGTNVWLTSVAFGSHSFVAAGDGVILQSDPIHSLKIAPGSVPMLTVDGPAGMDYRIEATETPATEDSWQMVTNLLSVITPHEWADSEAASASGRFYRAVMTEP